MANGLWTIEARSLDLGELPNSMDIIPLGGHNFWVLRDGDGEILSEMHGLATDRETGAIFPIGYDSDLYSLQVYELPRDNNYTNSIGSSVSGITYLEPN
ncbi:MAG: hypothetical protein IE881_07810 [Epsilonproteobacteria bacterium]|nr:hypothetical protein [Campylobacterota bacterium]